MRLIHEAALDAAGSPPFFLIMQSRLPGICALIIACLLAALGSADAKPRPPRWGFQNLGARYSGGYQIVTPTETLAGEASILIRAARDGRSATVTWTNTFYPPRGAYRITMRWNFRRDGTVAAGTVDPRANGVPATGTFKLNRARPIDFVAAENADPSVTASGQIKPIGGGALSIVVTLSGLPDGDVTYSFSGGRRR